METRQLKTFVTVFKSGSFTRAAGQLFTSQPAVSEQIKALEKRLDCRLFDRLGRSIKPTRKAEILYPKALSILADIENIKEELFQENKNISGELCLGASTIPGVYILPRLVTDFKEQHPEISFEIRIADSGEIINSVLNHDLFIGIVGTKIDSAKLNFYPFIEDELVLAAAVKRKISNTITLQELFALPFLNREDGSGTKKSIQDFWLKNDLEISQLNSVAVLGSNAAIKEAVKENLGVSILSRISIFDELDYGKIKEIKIKGLTIKRTFYITTLKNRSLPNPYMVLLKRLLGMEELDSNF